MGIDLTRPPSELFFSPGLETGIDYIEKPDWIIRPCKGARIELVAGSDVPTVNDSISRAISRANGRILNDIFEIRVSPVLLGDAQFHNSYATVGGRYLLNGAAGDRLRTKFDMSNAHEWKKERLLDFFRRHRRIADVSQVHSAPPSRSQPIAIELKNGHNFYHFLTETLGNLALFLDDGSDMPINLHYPGGEVRSFIPKFIQAVYPELFGRVRFVDTRTKYSKVRSTYNHRHYLYQVSDPMVAEAISAHGMDTPWFGLRADPRALKFMRMNSFDTSQRLLREVALSRLDPGVVKGLPRRIYVGRAEQGTAARARGVEGESALFDALAPFGFERVFFEEMSPLMQIASMQAADIMISPHGAGFANMLFAKSGAMVIEIGTRQTQLHRWGDFVPMAHVAGCRYATVFADVNTEDPEVVPSMTEGHVGIRIGAAASAAIIDLVQDHLSASSSPRSS